MALRKIAFFSLLFAFAATMMAQEATLKIHVKPPEAYIFIDGKPIGDGMRAVKVSPGDHEIGIYNYGYRPLISQVSLIPGQFKELSFTPEAVPGKVSGPWGVIYIQGAPRAAVLLNGKQPEYFVGHADEFDNHLLWKQQLVVPAGTHYVTVLDKDKEVWSGKLDVPANKRVMVDFTHDNQITVKDWPEGAMMQSLPRFTAGVASTTVAVAPVTGSFSAEPEQINCNGSATLAWKTDETLHTSITSDSENFNSLPMNGEQKVSPHKTTAYQFKTSGPGGIIEGNKTVMVNPEVKATLSTTPGDVKYLRIGDKVITQDSAVLAWDVSNADQVVLEPFGRVEPTGTKTVSPVPDANAKGSVTNVQTYKLQASNVCGGSETKIATVRLVAMVEPEISSVFFPTGYPDRGHPNKGLLKSQQERLAEVATAFKAYLEQVPDAKLTVAGYADERGPKRANQALSARRATIARDFLVAQGIPADRMELAIKGEEEPLTAEVVEKLEADNPQHPSNGTAKPRAIRLAYNRRVDLQMLPGAIESVRFFPHQATDSALLFDARWLGESKIHQASE